MEAMVKEWTDGRLDDLSHKVDRGFEHVDQRFNQFDQRFVRVETEVRGLRLEMRGEFQAIREELGGIQRALVFGSIAMSSAIIGGFAAIATQV
jgi:hypothetical protein